MCMCICHAEPVSATVDASIQSHCLQGQKLLIPSTARQCGEKKQAVGQWDPAWLMGQVSTDSTNSQVPMCHKAMTKDQEQS